MIRYLLDSDCAIYVMVGEHSLLGDRIETCELGEVALSAISLAEIELGAVLDKGPLPELLDAFCAPSRCWTSTPPQQKPMLACPSKVRASTA